MGTSLVFEEHCRLEGDWKEVMSERQAVAWFCREYRSYSKCKTGSHRDGLFFLTGEWQGASLWSPLREPPDCPSAVHFLHVLTMYEMTLSLLVWVSVAHKSFPASFTPPSPAARTWAYSRCSANIYGLKERMDKHRPVCWRCRERRMQVNKILFWVFRLTTIIYFPKVGRHNQIIQKGKIKLVKICGKSTQLYTHFKDMLLTRTEMKWHHASV